MNNVFHKKGWNLRTNPSHVYPLLIPMFSETCNVKIKKDFVNIKLFRYPKSSTPDPYNFNMYLFNHGKKE